MATPSCTPPSCESLLHVELDPQPPLPPIYQSSLHVDGMNLHGHLAGPSAPRNVSYVDLLADLPPPHPALLRRGVVRGLEENDSGDGDGGGDEAEQQHPVRDQCHLLPLHLDDVTLVLLHHADLVPLYSLVDLLQNPRELRFEVVPVATPAPGPHCAPDHLWRRGRWRWWGRQESTGVAVAAGGLEHVLLRRRRRRRWRWRKAAGTAAAVGGVVGQAVVTVELAVHPDVHPPHVDVLRASLVLLQTRRRESSEV